MLRKLTDIELDCVSGGGKKAIIRRCKPKPPKCKPKKPKPCKKENGNTPT